MSKMNDIYNILFECDTDDSSIIVKFLPRVELVFDKNKVDLQSMKMRDIESILYILELYGLTYITK